MGGAAAIVSEVVAGPDDGVSLVKRQLFRAVFAAEETAFPRQVALDDRPHSARKIKIAGPVKVAEQRVDIHRVHVVVGTRNVAVAMQSGLAARKVGSFVGWRQFWGDGVDVLARGPISQVTPGAVVPAEGVGGIGATPAEQLGAPGNRAVHHRALRFVPDGIGADIERCDRGVNKRVGSLDGDLRAEGAEVLLGFGEDVREVASAVRRSERDGGRMAIEAGTVGGDLAVRSEFFGYRGRGGIGNALESEVKWRGLGGRRYGDARGNDRERWSGCGRVGGREEGGKRRDR